MDSLPAGIIGFFVAALIAGGFSLIRRRQSRRAASEALASAEQALHQAEREADSIRKEAQMAARDDAGRARESLDEEVRAKRQQIQATEKKLGSLEVDLERRGNKVENREREIAKRESAAEEESATLSQERDELAAAIEQTRNSLERAAGLTREEAKQALVAEISEEAKLQAGRRIRQIEEEAREDGERRAKKIVAQSIARLAGEWVAERSISIVSLPSDDMKGRLIGREGRNIRAIEAATGVDLIIDDTPETVVISCHNPVRREIAKIAVEKLLSDGRIHPGRIEEVVRKSEKDVEATVKEAGQKALFEAGVHGVHQEIVKLLGMLRYRYSYGQNVLAHSIEASFICGLMAAELGLNVKQARRAALLHDIGKSLTHEVEGSHALIGADIARKYGESSKVCNAIAAHHEEVKCETILAPLVDAADALSGARPGARREVLESYVERLDELEKISGSYDGVTRSFAVQAGREVRVFVEPAKVDDDRAAAMARDIARRVEEELTYPGQIKVTVIRETRASDVAR
ncbi:MAG: ribonuclease Y [Candidatus Binatia bacterium]|nr:ribonuclease Y [Candidatus Binatia bacterium]MDG2011075.1 ribonuclease Y [Candidatus Binatia bacterium]